MKVIRRQRPDLWNWSPAEQLTSLREELEISYHDGALTISGERKFEEKSNDSETYRSERFFGRFHRTLTLPKSVQSDKARATYKDGILMVVLPKTEESKPKQIAVNIG